MNLLDFWPRKPKALPDELAEQMMMQIGAVSEQLAQQHVDQPDMREAARQVLYPLAASMPGFDWSVMYRYELDRLIEQRLAEQMAGQLAAQEIERIRLMTDEDDLLFY